MGVVFNSQIQLTTWVVLVSSWSNLMLYGIEIFLVSYLFLNCSSRTSKIFLVLAICLDTASTIGVCGHVYEFVEKDLSFSNQRTWTIPLFVVPTFLAGGMEQAFLVYRYWILFGRKSVCIVLWTVAVIDSLFAILAPLVTKAGPLRTQLPGNVVVIIASTLSCATDLTIASIMVWKLRNVPTICQSTRSLLRRISFITVMSGSTSACATLLMLITFFVKFEAYNFIFFCLGRIYSLTVLFNIAFFKNMQVEQKNSPGMVVMNTIDFQNLSPSRHIMSNPRTEIRSTALDPITKPFAQVPAFSMDTLMNAPLTPTSSRISTRDDSAEKDTIKEMSKNDHGG